MENYPSYSYPDSGDSSPRSREIDFDNPPPSWEDPNPSMNTNTKVKFMVSYGGKIQPRTLSYVGGETKILSVDRNIKFSTLYSKLSSMLLSDTGSGLDPGSGPGSGFTLKYQLPGEDLDALISVTNDDDLENMMHEYDRLCRGSSKPARLRIFLFPVQRAGSFGSGSSERELDRFGLEKTGSVPVPSHSNPTRTTQTYPAEDYLFGLEKTGSVPVQVPIPVPGLGPSHVAETDPQIDARIQELNRMQISGQEVKSDGGGVFSGGSPSGIPVGYWQQHQGPPPQQTPQVQSQQPVQHFQHHPQLHHQNQQIQQQPPQAPPQQQQQPMYMVHAPPQQGNIYHAPIMRPVAGQQGQGQGGGGGYYQVQRVGSDQIYRDQPVYGVGPGGKMIGGGGSGGYTEGMGLPVRPVVSGGVETNVGYQQVHTTTTQYSPTEMGYQHVAAYDSGSGRQVYYAAPHPGGGGVVTAPFQGVAVSGSGELRTVGSSNVPGDHKVVQK